MSRLLWWERATVAPEELGVGWVDKRWLGILTLVFGLGISLVFWPFWGIWALILGLVLGRLVALDLVYEVLPDVYTLPLLAVGVARSFEMGRGVEALVVVGILVVLVGILGRFRVGLGGGDVKLLGALLVGLGPLAGACAVVVGCVAWFPFACWKPKVAQPFGVPLVLGGVVLVYGAFHFCGVGGLAFGPLGSICLL